MSLKSSFWMIVLVGLLVPLLAACGAAPEPVIIRETVIVEKEVTRIVEAEKEIGVTATPKSSIPTPKPPPSPTPTNTPIGVSSPAAMPRISLQGKVMQDSYSNPVQGTIQLEYYIELRVKNSGTVPLTYDLVLGRFVTLDGKGLTSKITAGEEPTIMVIEAGEEWEHEFRTNGYTSDLLNDAKGGPLFFQLILVLEESIVAGPFVARLPEIQELPSLREDREVFLEFVDEEGEPVSGISD